LCTGDCCKLGGLQGNNLLHYLQNEKEEATNFSGGKKLKYRERKRAYYQENACNDSFICMRCGKLVSPDGAGSNHRNHCPYCLCSSHVDDTPGDRAANCNGIMEPIGVWVRKDGEWAIVHRCIRCGRLSSNRIAADDSQIKLMSIALKPLAQPPFPLENIGLSKPELQKEVCYDED
jgi:DNA-directed RNA polymerase subunit RPC12/RpoP